MLAGLRVIGDMLYWEKWMSWAERAERLSDATRRRSSFLMCIIMDVGLIDKGF
jgi:hypothetical protein